MNVICNPDSSSMLTFNLCINTNVNLTVMDDRLYSIPSLNGWQSKKLKCFYFSWQQNHLLKVSVTLWTKDV